MKNLYFINLKGGKILLTVIFFIAALTIYSNATILVYIGSSDGSPYHVPYQGIVNIPVWIDDIGSGTYALIDLVTLDSVVSERLGGNFYYPWWYEFNYHTEHFKDCLLFRWNRWIRFPNWPISLS
jgi:hypothetical protein